MIKRIVSVSVAALLVCITITTGVVLASDGTAVSAGDATAVAQRYVEKFSAISFPEWVDAKVSEPVTYYRVDGGNAAYEFTVLNEKGAAGFIIVSATRDWMPVLEMSGGKAPSAFLSDASNVAVEAAYLSAEDVSRIEPRILYWGALTYSVQLGAKMEAEGKAYFLPTGQIYDVPEKQPQLMMDKTQANNVWESLVDGGGGKSLRDAEADYLTGVPAYFQKYEEHASCDKHDDDADPYPDCIGIADDPWENYDGCAPISAAMVFGYWHNHGYYSTSDDEELIDHGRGLMTDAGCG